MKVCFLVNRKRRNVPPDPRLIARMREKLQRAGIEHRIILCESPGHGNREVSRAIDEGFDTVWIGGGDGSIFHVLNHLKKAGVTYGIVPMGTMNALARSLNMPPNPLVSIDWLLAAKAHPLDLGEIEGHRFAVFASIGLHAAIMHGISPQLKKRYGRLAFFVSGLQQLLRLHELPRFQLDFTQRPVVSTDSSTTGPIHQTGRSLVISNVHNYAGFGVVREQENLPALLDLQLFRKASIFPMLHWYWHLRFGHGWHTQVPHVLHYGAGECTVQSSKPLCLQLDGEPVELASPTRLEFRCIPQAVRFLQR